MGLRFKERVLQHQAHPLKLATDVGTGALSLVFLWEHAAWVAFTVMFVPPVVVSALLVCGSDLSSIASSPVGAYLRRYMSRRMELVRLGGFAVMAAAAWWHRPWALALGAAAILWGWTGGWILERSRVR